MTVNEQAIDQAIASVRQGTPFKKAAEEWGVAQTTLWDRLHGAQADKEVKKTRQRLSEAQEQFIADWAKAEERAGGGASKPRLRAFAQMILMEAGDTKPLGVRWPDRFLRRHPDVQPKEGKPLESERVRGSTKEAYEDFFRRLDDKIRSRGVTPANMANMDEHGMQEMETAVGKVIGDAMTGRPYVETPQGSTWVSVIECVTVGGKRLNPAVVFTGASLQGQWFPPEKQLRKDFPGWKFDKSVTGWSNSKICNRWLREMYLPETKPASPSDWRLLILDEHSSHVDEQFQLTAFKNTGIWPFNPSKILRDPEAIKEVDRPPITPGSRPSTPTNGGRKRPADALFTPKKGRDIIEQMGDVGRQQRVLARKAGQVVDRLAAENAALRAQIAKLATDLDASKPYTKKKVKENPNDGFATLQAIVEAQRASERAPKRRRANEPVIDEEVLQEAQDTIIHGLERIRDLEEC